MKKLILHLGAPKCGSSALQSSLLISQDYSTNSLAIPRNWTKGMGQGFGGPLLDFFKTPKEQEPLPKLIEEIQGNLSRLTAESIIVSDEALFGCTDSYRLGALLKILKPIGFTDILVLIATRRPSEWITSDYSQHIKQKFKAEGFIRHVIRREKNCDWIAYFNRFKSMTESTGIRLFACDSSDLLSAVEFLAMGQFSGHLLEMLANSNSANINKSLSFHEGEAARLKNLFPELNASLSEVSSYLKSLISESVGMRDFYWQILQYLDAKYGYYIDDPKPLPDFVNIIRPS
jgi:hypothetical protein